MSELSSCDRGGQERAMTMMRSGGAGTLKCTGENSLSKIGMQWSPSVPITTIKWIMPSPNKLMDTMNHRRPPTQYRETRREEAGQEMAASEHKQTER